MALEEIRVGTQGAWDEFYSWPRVWARARASVKSIEGPPGVRADLEAVSPDVREHRHRHRQRARAAVGQDGAAARARGQAVVPGVADARPEDADSGADVDERRPSSNRRADPPGLPGLPTLESTVRRLGALARRLLGTNAVIAGVCLAAIAPDVGRRDRAGALRAARGRRRRDRAQLQPRRRLRGVHRPHHRRRRHRRPLRQARVRARPAPRIDIPGLIADRTIDAARVHRDQHRGRARQSGRDQLRAASRTARSTRPTARTSPSTSRRTPARSSSASRSCRGSPASPPSRSRAGSTSPTASFGGIVSVQVEPGPLHRVLRRRDAAPGRRHRAGRARRHLARAPGRAAARAPAKASRAGA